MTAKTLTTTFSLDFIQRTLKTSGILLLLVLIFGSIYFNINDTLAVFSGGIWSMVNLIFLTALIRKAFRPDEKIDKLAVFGLLFIKFPLLYGSAYFLLTIEIFRPIPLVIGLSTVLAVMILKALGRALINIDVTDKEGQSRGMA
jgi:hypothetical protein